MAGEQEALDELKAQCVESESDEVHAAHADSLAAAYAAFANRDEEQEESNPASAGEVTNIDADVVVTSEEPEAGVADPPVS